MRRIIAIFVVLVLAGFVIAPPGCDRPAVVTDSETTDGSTEPVRKPATRVLEAEIVESLASPRTAEARLWLAAPRFETTKKLIKRWDADDALQAVEALYDAGAVKVSVADPVLVEKVEVASQFVIELPTNAVKREAIFEWIADWESDLRSEHRTTDYGQRYYEINLDR